MELARAPKIIKTFREGKRGTREKSMKRKIKG